MLSSLRVAALAATTVPQTCTPRTPATPCWCLAEGTNTVVERFLTAFESRR